MRSLLILTIFLAVIGCNQKTAKVTSGSVNAEAPFVWETSFPKNVHISEAYTEQEERDKITAMADKWEDALNDQINFFTFVSINASEKTDLITNPNQLRDNAFVIYKATNWPYPEYPDALAITQIFAIRYNVGESDEYVSIQEADIIMNYENFKFDDPNPVIWDYDFQTVLLHEMGHFLGLQHKPRSYPRANTVMYPSIYSYEIKQDPLTVDKQDLASKYNIVLPLTAGGSSIVGKGRTYTRKPNDPGEAVKMVLELRASGECVHHVNGEIVSRH